MRIPKKMGAHVVIVLLALTVTLPLSFLGSTFFIERWTYDLGLQFVSNQPSKKISVIAIDEKSIAEIGRWPWSRDYHSALIDRLSDGGAKVIAYPLFFLESQKDRRLDLIDSLLAMPNLHELRYQASQLNEDDSKPLLSNIDGVFTELLSVRENLDIDGLLAREIKDAGNVILPYHIGLGRQLGLEDEALSPDIQKMVITPTIDVPSALSNSSVIATTQVFPPISTVASAANGLGHLAVLSDSDGVIRQSPLVLNYYGKLLPSFSLLVAAKALNVDVNDIEITSPNSVSIANLHIATDDLFRMRNVYYGKQGSVQPFEVDSFSDVLKGYVSANKYLQKIVLVGVTASGIGDQQVTPVDSSMMPIIAMAHTLSNLLNEEYVVSPSWSLFVIGGLFFIVFMYLLFGISKLSAGIAALASFGLFAIIMGSEIYMLAAFLYWLPLTAAAVFLLLGHILITTHQYFQVERGKRSSDRESAEGNRMLGLSFQGQGQLDVAFEKFQKCPLDESMMKILYNLALDFERKRQFSKAAVVYQYMSELDADYKDIQQRNNKALQLENTVILGGTNHSGPGQSMSLLDDSVEKPMLGRYEIIKELGKGAMGIVYQGRDPKIGRIVAIKTLALAQEFDEDEIESVKERFFKEAETAGRLNHPNIVTVYDAGSEHDLAYIAMEFLPGEELTPYTKKDNLLPLQEVFDILIDACKALAYANENNVVHRDIKPANIMYHREKKKVVLTDFGIARVTDASKTKTGTILGTPSYMSPEQFRGEKSDGRADIFSLGVMSFQLVTGALPFNGDSLASLMYSITNDACPDPSALRDDIPEEFNEVLHNSLEKDRENRYGDAHMMLEDLIACRNALEKNND